MEIIKFINSHENWEELLQKPPYSLIIKRKNGLILFKYSQIKSDFNEPICREARGLILEEGTWNIVRYAFKKFFNVGEPFADEINWNYTEITEKYDGSLITLYWYGGKWNLATNGTINAYSAPMNSSGKTFGQAFDEAAEKAGLDYNRLSPGYNYTFELTGPDNMICIYYPETKLYHLSTRDLLTLDEVEVDIGIAKPERYTANSLEEIKSIVSGLDKSHEGVVIRDMNGNRVKLKTQIYFKMHRFAANGKVTDETLLKLILKNDTDELLVYFPSLLPRIEKLKMQREQFLNVIEQIEEKVKNYKECLLTKKQLAFAVEKKPFKEIYYSVFI